MRDDAILAGGIHGLENQQHGVAAGGVQKLLLGAQPLDVILENGLVIGIVAVDRAVSVGHLARSTLAPSRTR